MRSPRTAQRLVIELPPDIHLRFEDRLDYLFAEVTGPRDSREISTAYWQRIAERCEARKVRKLHHGRVLAGFAGATADAFTLFERFEAKLEKHQGHLTRAAIELTKDWRTDRVLRRLEAMLAVADLEASLIITGNGDVLEPEHGLVAIGSGGPYAQAAAKALLEHTDLPADQVVKKALEIAGELCIYTNMNHTIETL